MKKQCSKHPWLLFFVCTLLFFSCTNYKTAEFYEVGEYIEKQFGSQSAEYMEFCSLWDDMFDSSNRAGKIAHTYGDQSREYYLALQEVVQKQQLMQAYFKRIGAKRSADYFSSVILANKNDIKKLAPLCEYGACDMCGTQCVEGHYYYTDGKYYYDSPHRCGKCHRKKEVEYFIDVLEGRKH